MSEKIDQNATTIEGRTQANSSPGMVLRHAREACGMHVDTLAANLKVPVAKIDALESDRWDLLHDAMFVRALAASVCRTLKLDPSVVLEQLPTVTPRLMPNGAGINAPFRAIHRDAAGSLRPFSFSRPLGIAVLVLLVSALGLIFWPMAPQIARTGSTGAVEAGKAPEAVVPTPNVASDANVASPPTIAASALFPPDSGNQSTFTPPASGISMAAGISADTSVSANLTKTMPDVQLTSSGSFLVFRTTGPSWIQVTDATGHVVLKRLMAAGESSMASGALPLAVLVGRADVTAVEVRGNAFDISRIARDNVARFEVK